MRKQSGVGVWIAPVTAQVTLRDDGILAGPTAAALAFLTKIGLR